MRNIAAVVVVLFMASACAQQGTKQTVGGLGGAVLGGLLGSQVGGGSGRLWATGAGVLLGAIVGSEIGRGLDEVDKQQMAQTTEASLEHTKTGATSTWSNPDTGNSGTVTPTSTYQASSGEYCREYRQTVDVGGEEQEAYGTACRQPDGSWKIVNS
ncbi:MAG: RT0821/Lpp0805 family surface protein [Alphaproteobacteria bacterium]